MVNTKAYFGAKNEPKGLDETEAKYEVNKYVFAAIVSQYIDRRVRLVSNMNKIYGIIWVQCTPRLQ